MKAKLAKPSLNPLKLMGDFLSAFVGALITDNAQHIIKATTKPYDEANAKVKGGRP